MRGDLIDFEAAYASRHGAPLEPPNEATRAFDAVYRVVQQASVNHAGEPLPSDYAEAIACAVMFAFAKPEDDA